MKFTTTSGPFPVKSFFRNSPSSASSLEILRLESKRFNQQLKQVKKMAANTVKKKFIPKIDFQMCKKYVVGEIVALYYLRTKRNVIVETDSVEELKSESDSTLCNTRLLYKSVSS